ncbi:uncharacterized protein MONOS_9479 [Monocercomonoides exilis]|uniref:uncharacterized protein n=1 Tax=Monocercomonoides exilis TaxID=2049356 RepID=UPI00355ACC84|nr:hypothetical protein MONOS_9479 [Monocercomonoides exilis]|eukprot:MONOS_9479.1-p1 / transcript=MONOS_9479.1 / gene=MONOS_9479 / organism=Monocercomonoides_exilis_PA203 / gene_product=unspecified product / transcript_product=unspecified product / location=Mono_scaffold00393:21639-22556(+) / protein_length=306 / sequence_SO=supercontig / SO=protein_coding / is_pseudo=false
MILSSPSAVPAKSIHGRTKSDVINSGTSVSSSAASSSSQSSHPSQHLHAQQSTFQPFSLKSSLRFDELQSHSTSSFLRSISNSSSSLSSSFKRRSMLCERPLVLQSSRAPAASLYLRLPSDEVEVLRGVTSLLWSMKAALSLLSPLGEENNSNRNCNRSSRSDRSDRSDRITDYPLFAGEDGNTAKLGCLLPSSASSKHLAMLTKASTGRLFVSPGKGEGQIHSHSQSQTLMKTQTHTQNRTQSTIFSPKKRAGSFTSSMFTREVTSCRIQLLCGTVLPFNPFLSRMMALVDGKHVQCSSQIKSN